MVWVLLQATAHRVLAHVQYQLAFCLLSPEAALLPGFHGMRQDHGPRRGELQPTWHPGPLGSYGWDSSGTLHSFPLCQDKGSTPRGPTHLRTMFKRGCHRCFQGLESCQGVREVQQGSEWWDKEAPLQPRGNRAAGRSGWVQIPAQPPSGCVNLSTSHNIWRPGFCHLYRREAAARSTCYIVASSWYLAQRQCSVRDVH